jgi:hypothetical protein
LDPNLIGLGGTTLNHEDIGFYALEYTLSDGTKIIAYRDTDDNWKTGAASDAKNGFGIGGPISTS